MVGSRGAGQQGVTRKDRQGNSLGGLCLPRKATTYAGSCVVEKASFGGFSYQGTATCAVCDLRDAICGVQDNGQLISRMAAFASYPFALSRIVFISSPST